MPHATRTARPHVLATVLVLLLALAGLVAVPTAAQADEPTVRTEPDGTVTYADPSLAGEPTRRVSGTLYEVAVEDGPERPPVIVTDDGAVVPVELAEPVDASGGEVVARLVEGQALDAALDGRQGAPVEVASAQVAEVTESAAVDHRVYVAVVTNAGSAAPASSAVVEGLVDQAAAWWTTEAGAQGSFSRAATATVRYASSLSSAQRCGINAGTSALWNEAAARFPGVSFSGASGNHLVVVVDDDGCDGTGIGTLGSSFANGGMVTMTDNQTIFAVTAIHELGHNVSLEHANGPAGEYWDLYSVMGLAASYTFNGQPVVFTPSALDSARRDQLGFDVAGELEVVTEGQQVTRALAPRGSASGLRGLEVRRGGTSYWVEWRSGTARDDGAFYEGYSGSNFGATRYNPGVTVVTRPTGGNGSTELQSLTVGGTRFGARTSGQTFTDGDLTITVGAIGTTASVSVQNGTAPSPDLPSASPTVSGTPVVDGTLTAGTAGWESGSTFAYQWRVGGVDVAGATASTYSPRPADVGKSVTVRVTGSKTGFTSVTRESAATAAVAAGTLTAPAPTVSGTPVVGGTLTVTTGAWGPAPVDLVRQWRVGGVDVDGETGATFSPRPEDVGKTVTVRVTGSKSGYTSVSRESAPTAPVEAAPSRSWRAVSAGAASTCGITTTSALLCWGENGSGRLGDGTTTRRLVPTPVEGAATWKAVSVGGQHACAVSTTARLFCWGENGSGQLGLNSTTDRTTPTQVGTRADWASVSAGTSHTCATKTDGRLFCWGANGSGRVGDGTTTTRRSAVQVGTKADWANVSAGSEHTCAVKTTGARYCWGKNTSRQLGSGTTTATKPRAVGTGVSSTSVGSLHSCSIQRTYRLACWGANARGQVGRGTTSTYVATPVTIGTLTWRNVDGGGLHTCGVAGTGRLYCWGANTSSQLGHNGVTGRDEPGAVGTATDWASVSAGTSHSCAVTKDGRLFCWGANASGQLGRGDTVGRATPDQVP